MPTNTDYKVGIKVKKNGQDINLQPSQLTVGDYTMDAEKTNGYVTYKASTGDSASFTQLDVKLDKAEGAEVYEYNGIGNPSSVALTNVTVLSVDLSPFAGREITPDQLYFANVNTLSNNPTPYTEQELVDGGYLKPYMDCSVYNSTYQQGEGTKILNPDGTYIAFLTEAVMKDTFNYWGWKEGDPPLFITYNPSIDPQHYLPATSFKIQEGCIFRLWTTGIPKTRSAAGLLKLWPFDAVSADFKLNLNAHKSQKGDINLVGRASTINFAGTDGQGNPFSYDIITK